MTLDKLVTSLELSKELKELGVKQDSLFYWVNFDKEYEIYDGVRDWNYVRTKYRIVDKEFISTYLEQSKLPQYERCNKNTNRIYPAPTSGELGEIINCTFHTIKENNNKWSVFVTGHPSFQDKSEANASALCLIYLLKNNLITLSRGEK